MILNFLRHSNIVSHEDEAIFQAVHRSLTGCLPYAPEDVTPLTSASVTFVKQPSQKCIASDMCSTRRWRPFITTFTLSRVAEARSPYNQFPSFVTLIWKATVSHSPSSNPASRYTAPKKSIQLPETSRTVVSFDFYRNLNESASTFRSLSLALTSSFTGTILITEPVFRNAFYLLLNTFIAATILTPTNWFEEDLSLSFSIRTPILGTLSIIAD